MSLTSQCLHQVKHLLLNSIGEDINSVKKLGDVVVDNVVVGLLRADAESNESLKLKPATLGKSIAEEVVNVKKEKYQRRP